MRRSVLFVGTAMLLALAACANPAVPGSGGTPGTPEPDTTRLDVYETMIRHLAAQEAFSWNQIVVVRGICANAGSPMEKKGCGETFTAGEEAALIERLADVGSKVRFVEDPTPLFDDDWFQGEPDRIVVWLGPIEDEGGELHVGGSFGCGGLCGSGATWILREQGAGWKVTGSTGSTWIA